MRKEPEDQESRYLLERLQRGPSHRTGADLREIFVRQSQLDPDVVDFFRQNPDLRQNFIEDLVRLCFRTNFGPIMEITERVDIV